ncbi:hypothetical protein [Pantoea sp. 18069]|uniref:hypothetical protein n=1 Tax=Pantoea sp. 18069 TaxID=2681415 RepID=UPI00135CE0BB|nr:hypothetical protein [Pantoea sp. 18069]
MNESSVTQNRKKRKISDALNESPMTHFGRVPMQNNDLATASNESAVTFRSGTAERPSTFVFSVRGGLVTGLPGPKKRIREQGFETSVFSLMPPRALEETQGMGDIGWAKPNAR